MMANSNDLSYTKAGYKKENWKWVNDLTCKEEILQNPSCIKEKLSLKNLLRVYDLDKYPKALPCLKKCSNNAWCLLDVYFSNKSKKVSLTKQSRDYSSPIGLQNTANTCWINSALQSLFHLRQFRNCVNSIQGFQGDKSLNKFIYLLQAMFEEMDCHSKKALECHTGSVFEKLAIFATEKIMQKDQDYEVLKCVSEFIENTIDNLLGDPITGSTFSPLFQTSLYRIARWKCTSCQRNHIRQLPPATSYIMAAYVTSDECALDHCLLDLQTETQTGVWLICGQDGEGCGASVKVDRVVTPKILSLPSFLIIRNNSLVDSEARRRNHVVYPDTLDLSQHTCESAQATYSLRAVIYHHGYWIKHFSAHVKTEEGKWFNFNDEKVSELVPQNGMGIPTEINPNYFSLGPVASKYKKQPNVRISRGAFIWIYEKTLFDSRPKSDVKPPQTVIDYVSSIQGVDKVSDEGLLKEAKQSRKNMLSSLMVTNKKDKVLLISHRLLSDWLSSNDLKFQPQISLLASSMCEHRKFDSFSSKAIKCIKEDKAESLLKGEFGIHSSLPYSLKLDEALCLDCVSRDVHHILFRESLKEFSKFVRKQAIKEFEPGQKPIGLKSLKMWTLIALKSYMKDHGFLDFKANGFINASCSPKLHNIPEDNSQPEEDQENEAPNKSNGSANTTCPLDEPQYSAIESQNVFLEDLEETKSNINVDEEELKSYCNEQFDDGDKSDVFTLFNQDIVCPHNKMDPQVQILWIPASTMEKVQNYCKGSLHPSISKDDFEICSECQVFMDEAIEMQVQGQMERKLFHNLFSGRKRPIANRDVGSKFYLIENDFVYDWRSFVKTCEKGHFDLERPKMIDNSEFLCDHDCLKYCSSSDGPLATLATFIFEDEWNKLNEFYVSTHEIEASFDDSGNIVTKIGSCTEGCVELQAALMYEEQFNFDWGLIYIKQVNSVSDIPSYQNGIELSQEDPPRKRQKTTKIDDTEGGSSSSRAANQRLVRGSREFCCNDTIKQVQNFIAEMTGIWPILQTMWLGCGIEHGPEPMLLTDDHRNMTLRSLRIKEMDTIYFKAAIEDMELAAGNGVTEYEELPDFPNVDKI